MLTRVTIADDDPETREIVRRVLQARHIVIVEAASGAELIELLVGREASDLLVTDVSMPWMSGLDVVANARRTGFTTPTLVITGSDEPALVARVHALGRARLLRKPFGIAELRAAIDDLLEGCRL